MNADSWLWGIVEWGSMPVGAVVAGILVWKKLYRDFPLFFSFILAAQATTIVRFVTRGHAWTYFYAYWVSDLALAVLILLVVYELFALRLFPGFYRVAAYRFLFPAATTLIAFGGWLTAMEATDRFRAFIILDRVFNFVTVALLAFFVSLMLLMGREWKGRHDFAIAFGLVFSSAGDLISKAIWVRTNYRQSVARELGPVTFDIACLIWLCSFWPRETASSQPSPAPLNPEMAAEARRWESALKEWLALRKRASRDTE